MQPDPYRTPQAPLANDVGPRAIRVRALAAGSLLVVISAYTVNATLPSDLPIALGLGIVLLIAVAGGFVAASLGRPWHAAHAGIVGGVLSLCALALTSDPLSRMMSQREAWAAMTGFLVGASLVGGWIARAVKLPLRRA
jgi:hypothetical protein